MKPAHRAARRAERAPAEERSTTAGSRTRRWPPSFKELGDRVGELAESIQAHQGARRRADAGAGPATGAPPAGAGPTAVRRSERAEIARRRRRRRTGRARCARVSALRPAPAPRELYSQAYADYARGNYDLAIQGFTEYIRNYPATDFTDNAQYWIGECLYGKKMYAEAIEAWNVLFRDYPSSDKLPDGRVKKGMALERLGRRSQALVEYRYVVDRFPNSQAARIAREHLNP